MRVYYIGAIRFSSDDIYHHGIKGQSWGVRNGPPYPLNYSAHSKIEKKLNPRNRISTGDDKLSNQHNTKTEKKLNPRNRISTGDDKYSTKKTIATIQRNSRIEARYKTSEILKNLVNSKEFKIGAAVAVSVLAAYGTYRLVETAKISKITNAVKNISKQVNSADIEKIGSRSVFEQFTMPENMQDYYSDMVDQCRTTFERLPKKYTQLSSIPKATKDYVKEFFENSGTTAAQKLVGGINHGADIATNNLRNQNCGLCSVSIIARLKGYDVTAAEIPHALPREILEDCFDGGKFLKSTTRNSTAIMNELIAKGNGSYGIMFVPWKTGGAHFISYAVKNGAVEFLDGQIEKTLSQQDLFGRALVKDIFVMDCTSCDLTDYALRCLL